MKLRLIIMAVQIGYDQDSKLILSGIHCDCGGTHNLPTQDIYVGTGLIEKTPDYIKKRGLGLNCVLVADNNTWPLVGQKLTDLLRSAGFTVQTCLIRRSGEMEPDERACGEVLLTMQPDTAFLISVGSGSITDTTRVVAVRTGKPFVCVGTAPSMDGYTSVVAPLLLRGVKIHRAAVCPEIIVCDLDILRTAPMNMVISGVGDVLGKYIARADWQIGHIINDEPYCTVCGEIVTDAVNKLVDNIAEIKSRSESGIRILIEALLLAGVTIMIVGHTRAVASVEHNIVHYWDMMKLLQGQKQPPHGTAVGMATLLVWPVFLRFAGEDLSRLDLDDIRSRRMDPAARRRWLIEAYKDEAANEIMRDNPDDFLSWAEQERRIRRAQERFDEIKAVIDSLPPYERIQNAMQDLGAPMNPADLDIDRPLLNRSMYAGKDYRTRYSLFKTLDECGLLADYLSDYPL
jgi:glycerol-1-phosphate dehydrogenase [NAD(P)+]